MTSPASCSLHSCLRPLLLVIGALAIAVAFPLAACSGDDSSSPNLPLEDASQPAIPKIEAGSACATNNDCQSGLSCLYPATTCQAFRVCTATPPSPCDDPQPACSCLAEPIVVCDGYATDPIDPTATCEAGAVVTEDGGQEGGSTDSGTDAAGPDASDASSD
jgi:hypothetical protein